MCARLILFTNHDGPRIIKLYKLFFLFYIMGKIQKRETKKKRNFKKISYTILIAFAIVSFWRGVWGLMDVYLFPNNYILSLSISVLIGLIILYSTKHIIGELA